MSMIMPSRLPEKDRHIGQLRDPRLVEFVDEKVMQGVSIRQACKMWASQGDLNLSTVIARYRAMRDFPVRVDRRCRRAGLDDISLLGTIGYMTDTDTPYTESELKRLAYYRSVTVSENTRTKWLSRFKRKYRSILRFDNRLKTITLDPSALEIFPQLKEFRTTPEEIIMRADFPIPP